MKVFEYLDAADRLVLFVAAGHPIWRISQRFNVFHSENRHRGITDKRGPNGEEIKLKGPSRFIGNAMCCCDRSLSRTKAKLIQRRDIADMHGRIVCEHGRAKTNFIGRPCRESWSRYLTAWNPSFTGQLVLEGGNSLAQGKGDAVEVSTASHECALQEEAGVQTA